MASKKNPPKPLLATKFDYTASVDNVVQQALLLIQTFEFAERNWPQDAASSGGKALLERVAALKEAIFIDE